jgi:hypothetical protein
VITDKCALYPKTQATLVREVKVEFTFASALYLCNKKPKWITAVLHQKAINGKSSADISRDNVIIS